MSRPPPCRAPGRTACAARRLARAFARGERGTVSVETAILMPVLIAALLALTAVWDLVRQTNAAVKANYTVADAISREAVGVTRRGLDEHAELFAWLAGSRGPTSLRLSVVRYGLHPQTAQARLELLGSCRRGAALPAISSVEPVRHVVPSREEGGALVPALAVGDVILVLETEVEWRPPVASVLVARQVTHRTATRPRFVNGAFLCDM